MRAFAGLRMILKAKMGTILGKWIWDGIGKIWVLGGNKKRSSGVIWDGTITKWMLGDSLFGVSVADVACSFGGSAWSWEIHSKININIFSNCP